MSVQVSVANERCREERASPFTQNGLACEGLRCWVLRTIWVGILFGHAFWDFFYWHAHGQCAGRVGS